MTKLAIRSDILEYAAICAARRARVADPAHRVMLQMMRPLWRTFAHDLVNLTNTQIVAEFECLADLHARVVTATRPTRH